MNININVGDKVWLVRTPYYYEEFSQDIKPELYLLIESDGHGWNVLINLHTKQKMYYGEMDDSKWKKYQGDLFDEIKN